MRMDIFKIIIKINIFTTNLFHEMSMNVE